MGSPTVFSGSRTKLLSSKGLSLKDGTIVDNDGVPNFIKNGHAEIDTTGWATYADAAQSTPVDGTGGTANVTWARTTTTPLAGAGSFTFTKDTANRQGQGVSYTFSVDPAFRAKVCNIQFDYIFTNINGSFDTSNPNLTVYIYDVTNATVIQPSSFGLLSNSQTISDTFQSSFQTSATGSQYRLIFHVATVSTSGYTIKFDNIQVTPTQYAFGTPVTDWQSYTPTFVGLGTVTIAGCFYRRVGDSLEVKARITTGTVNGSAVTMTLPSGLTFNSLGNTIVGSGWAQGLTGKDFFITAGSNVFQFIANNGAGANLIGTDFGSSQILDFYITNTRINGWSSSVQMSDQTSTRVIVLNASGTNNTSFTGTATAVQFIAQSNQNTVGSYNQATGVYTFLTSGFYNIKAVTDIGSTVASGVAIVADIYKNNTTILASSYSRNNTASTVLLAAPVIITKGDYFNAGDYIVIRSSSTSGSYTITNGTYTYLSIERISGPNQIAASETVSAKALNSSGQSIPTGSETTITGWVKKYDTHGMFNTNGVFTIPISGKYRLTGMITYQSSSIPVGTQWDLFGIQSGSSGDYLRIGSVFPIINSSSNTYVSIMGSHEFEARAGDTIAIKTYQSSGGARTLLNSDSFNHIELTRIGV